MSHLEQEAENQDQQNGTEDAGMEQDEEQEQDNAEDEEEEEEESDEDVRCVVTPRRIEYNILRRLKSLWSLLRVHWISGENPVHSTWDCRLNSSQDSRTVHLTEPSARASRPHQDVSR